MDKIYSRRRIAIPKMFFSKFPKGKDDLKKAKLLKILLIIIIAICVMVWIIGGINPIINKLCIDTSKKEATLVSNQKATEVMSNYVYEDLVTIYRDDDGNITMLQSNIIAINEITSDIAIKIQEEFSNKDKSKIYLKLRELYRNKNIFWNRTKYSNRSLYVRNSYDKSKK